MGKRRAYYVYSFMRLAESCDAERFAKDHPDPVLIVTQQGVADRGEYVTYAGVTEQAALAIHKGRRLPPGAEVHLIRKDLETSSPGMITVGRSSKSDIMLTDPKVSKFHAYLVRDTKDRRHCRLADAESSNGTFLNGDRLPPRKLRRLKNGDHVRLGTNVLLKFYLPEGFWEMLTG